MDYISVIITIIIIIIIGILIVIRYNNSRPTFRSIKNKDGSVTIITSQGVKTTVNPNGITIVENPDGTKTVTNKNTNKEKTINKDGSSTTTDKNTGKITKEPPTGFQNTIEGVEKVFKGLEPLVTNPMFYAGVGTNIVVSLALPKLFNGMLKRALAKVVTKASKTASGVAIKTGTKYLLTIAKKVVAKLSEKLAKSVTGKLVLSVGSKMAAKASAMAAKISAAGPVGVALAVFDIISMSLDLSDSNGYNNMGTKKMYIDIKKEIDAELTTSYAEEGGKFATVIGPISNLTETELTDEISKKMVVLMDMSDPDNIDPLVKPMIDAIRNDIISEKITETDLENDTIIEAYSALIDMDALIKKAMGLICIDKDGKLINDECTYKDKQSCDKSYSWPIPETEQYTEYDNTTGTCKTASPAVRIMCETAKLPYDSNRGICDITENYCKKKGADWSFNKDINENDCIIKPGQEFSEFLFGTTITRSFKQVFDPEQYEKCKPDEIDDGYFCRNPEACTKDQVNILGLCYNKCGENGNACYKECPPNFRDDGAYCAKPAALGVERRSPTTIPCKAGETDESGSCWIKTTGRPVGTIPKYNDCKDGSYDVGGTCWMHNYKTSWGSVNCTGGRPWRPEGYSDCYTNDFPYVYTNIGDRGTSCPTG